MRRFRSAPLWVLLPVLFVTTGGSWWALGLVAFPGERPLAAHVLVATAFGGVMTVVFGLLIARARRRAGSAGELALMGRAARTGEVPVGADLRRWTTTFEDWRRQHRRTRWLSPVVFGVLVLDAVWLASTASPVWWAFVVFFVVALVATVVDGARRMPVLEAVLAELRRRAADEPPAVPAPTASPTDAPR